MPLPAIGIFTVIVGWLIKKVGLKAIIVTLQISISVLRITASITFFLLVISGLVMFYNMFNDLMAQFDTISNSSNTAYQVGSASGLFSALSDVFSVYVPTIVLLLTYKLSRLFMKQLTRLSDAVHKSAMSLLY